MNKIPFNRPTVVGTELEFISKAIEREKFCGDGYFTELSKKLIEQELSTKSALLTTSCTHALEMCAILLDIKEGDEVIMPSYTFVSTANAFILRGAKIVFVDILPDTMNVDSEMIEGAISINTKAIVVVHYAGLACEMDKILTISNKYSIPVIEDAAQAIGATYKGKKLGTIGTFGCLSFHETKNIQCGEGGALLINDHKYIDRAEILREKGTNRKKFLHGLVDKYTWVELGSSYLPSELNAAFLYAQLLELEKITQNRKKLWLRYKINLSNNSNIQLPLGESENNDFNAHMFFIKLENEIVRKEMINILNKNSISSAFHYIPLHTAPAAIKYSKFYGEDKYTTLESSRLLRLPLFHTLTNEEVDEICELINKN